MKVAKPPQSLLWAQFDSHIVLLPEQLVKSFTESLYQVIQTTAT
jgi:hypothetical protein